MCPANSQQCSCNALSPHRGPQTQNGRRAKRQRVTSWHFVLCSRLLLTSNGMISVFIKEPSASPSLRQNDADARRKSVELSRMRIVGVAAAEPLGSAPSASGPGNLFPDSPPSPTPPNTELPSTPLGSLACRNCSCAVRIVCESRIGVRCLQRSWLRQRISYCRLIYRLRADRSGGRHRSYLPPQYGAPHQQRLCFAPVASSLANYSLREMLACCTNRHRQLQKLSSIVNATKTLSKQS